MQSMREDMDVDCVGCTGYVVWVRIRMNLDKEGNMSNGQERAGILDLSFEIIFITKIISLHGNSTQIAFLWGGLAIKSALVILNPFLAILLSPGVL